MLEEVAKRVMEFAQSYAREFLAMSKTIAKIYRFCWPIRIYIGWIFEDPKTAKEVSKIFRVFFRVKKEWRRMNGREFPAVFVDFKEWIDF